MLSTLILFVTSPALAAAPGNGRTERTPDVRTPIPTLGQLGESCLDAPCDRGLVCNHARGTATCEEPPPVFNGDVGYCTVSSPCEAFQGHCSIDDECESGLECRPDMGHVYGFARETGVCVPKVNLSCPEDYFPINEWQHEPIKYRFPIEDETGNSVHAGQLASYVDRWPGPGIDTFDGWHFTRETHNGTDYMISPGAVGSVHAVAAADAVVTSIVDNQLDDCGLNLDPAAPAIACGEESEANDGANRVNLCHADGRRTEYLHLQQGIEVVEDQAVACGDRLGLVGSSGQSLGPHLHFQVRDGSGTLDPYDTVVANRLWVDQGDVIWGAPSTQCE